MSKKKKQKQDKSEKEESLTSHLEELRKTIIGCFITISIGSAICYGLCKELLVDIVLSPLDGIESQVIYISVVESFVVEMKVALLAGITITTPITFGIMWHFVSPAFLKRERKWIMFYTCIAVLLFSLGVSFAYCILVPFCLHFLLNVSSISADAMLSINSYVGFLCKILASFGLVFELPLVTFFVISYDVIPIEKVKEFRKYMLLICFCIAAIITPPDVFSLVYVAVPMYVMYGMGIILGRISIWRRVRRIKKEMREQV